MSANSTNHVVFVQRQPVAGFSLLEVLIALVVLSVGLLGIAAMISTSVKTNDSAYMRTQATALAYSIIDRMRTNQLSAQNGDYDIALGTPAPGSSTICDGGAANCDSATLAAYDVAQWKQSLASPTNGLPSGDGSIVSTATLGLTTVTVTVQWNDSRAYAGLKKSGAPVISTFSLAVSSVF